MAGSSATTWVPSWRRYSARAAESSARSAFNRRIFSKELLLETHNNIVHDATGQFTAGRPILIRQAHIVSMDDSVGDLTGDVLVKDGKIVEVARSIEAGQAAVIDGRHKILIPGFV